MDPLSNVSSLQELGSYRVGGFEAGGDGSIRFEAYDGVKCYSLTSGTCWLAVEGAGEPMLLEQGDCFMLPQGRPFTVTSNPELPSEDGRRHFLASPAGTLVKLNDFRGVTVVGSHARYRGCRNTPPGSRGCATRPNRSPRLG